ncbi:MAG TPA: primosomal protein N', partial [Clostridiaceae bacterium]|nr:primosomal protein N' [Clostridiaceae bacterium]
MREFCSVKSEFTQGINIKYEDFYAINDEIKAKEFLNKIDKRVKKQQDVIECIYKNGCLNSKSIVGETGCSKSAINSLYKKGLVKKIKKEVYRNPISKKYNYDKIQLNTDQIDAVNKILNSIGKSDNTVLIHGVTGSGKTEIYLKACEKLMEKG